MPLRGLIRILLPSTPADIKLTDGCGTTHELLERPRGEALRWDAPIIMGSRAACVCSVTQSCPTLCGPMNCLPVSSVHGIFQARILEQIAISFSRGSSWPGDWTCISCIGRHSLPLSHLDPMNSFIFRFLNRKKKLYTRLPCSEKSQCNFSQHKVCI